MEEPKKDVNTESTSSTDSTNADKSAASATAQPSQADQSKGLAAAIAKGIASVEPKEANPEEQTTEKEVVEGEPEKETETGKEPTEADQKAEGESDKTKETEDKGPVPYERFQEVIAEKNEATEWRKQAEPLVQAYQGIASHLQQNGVSPEEFHYWMEVAALAKSDPAKAMEKLNPQIQLLQSSTGDVLSPELQAAVDAGEITLDWAKKMAKAQGQSKFVEKQATLSKEQLEAQQQRQYEQQIHNTLTNWLTSKQATDPDLKPAGQNEPDGKLELWRNKLTAMWQSGAIKDASPQGLIQAAEQALQAVNGTLGRFKPKVNGQTHVRSSQSNRGAAAPQIKSLADAVKAGFESVAPRR